MRVSQNRRLIRGITIKRPNLIRIWRNKARVTIIVRKKERKKEKRQIYKVRS